MLRIVKQQPMQRDPNLHRVEFLDTNRNNIASLDNWCIMNHVLSGDVRFTMTTGEITVVCTEEQLSFIMLKFGAGND